MAGAAPLIAVSACLVLTRTSEPEGPPRAAIVDQLSLTFPNPDFVEEAMDTMERAGYAVDYYPGEEITVDFYRELPKKDYDYLVLRVHSAPAEWRSSPPTGRVTLLFTVEPFNATSHPEDSQKMTLGRVRYYESEERYFGIGPHFLKKGMQGQFDDTVIIAMGCDGLKTEALAKAFVERGARTFVGWSDPVSASHTDTATERLLEHLLIGGLSAEEAVAQTMAEVGPDPAFDSVLLSYPPGG